MLLRDEARAYTGAQMLVKKARHSSRMDVLPTLEEAPGEDGDGVGVGLDEPGHEIDESVFILRCGDLALCEGKES